MFQATAPSPDDTNHTPVTHAAMLKRLKELCDGVEFIVRDLTQGIQQEKVQNELGDWKNLDLDGVIIYGCPANRSFLRSGLPTINVAVLNDFMDMPFPEYKKNRVIDASLDPWCFSMDPDVPKRMFDDLVAKIKLIRTITRMRSEHILTVTDSPFVNVIYGDVKNNPPPDFNRRILGSIQDVFGTKVTKIGSQDVVEEPYVQGLWDGRSDEANEIAQRWIRQSQKMTHTIKSEVVRSAKVYLVMKWLMRQYDATSMAFHIRWLTKERRPETKIFPALATSEFQLHNVVAKCQSHLNIVLSEMLLQYAYGRPSMLGDYSVDTYNNTSMVQHCEGPWNPWGDERRVPYILTDHRERLVRSRANPGVGAASWNLYPGNEPVTMWQIDVSAKEILVHTGKTVPMLSEKALYRDHLYEMM